MNLKQRNGTADARRSPFSMETEPHVATDAPTAVTFRRLVGEDLPSPLLSVNLDFDKLGVSRTFPEL